MVNIWIDPRDFRRRFFVNMEREFAEAEELINRLLFKTVNEVDFLNQENKPYYYGYQVIVGSDGRPYVREFGNLKQSPKGELELAKTREPLLDTTYNEKEKTFIITAEMPGVNKEDIKININDKEVTIKAEKGDKKYFSQIPLESKTDNESIKATYSNGILELKIKVKEETKTKGKEVKVE